MKTDLQAIRHLVTDAQLPPDVQQTVLARFDRLPSLYADLARTYESRFADQIVAAIDRMVRLLSATEASPDAAALAATVVQRLRAMHDQHGIAVTLKPPPVVKAPRRKASRKASR
jgi:hypothetical protein